MNDTKCPSHHTRSPYLASVSALCEECLAQEGQSLIDADTYECLPHWLRTKNYNRHQGLVRLGMAMQQPEKLATLINRADASYTR